MFDPLIDQIPDAFAIEGRGARPTITIPLAASENGNQWVALEVRLWPAYWRGVECHEFKFAIIYFDDELGEPAVIFDRNMAAGYVERVRHLVMPCVCAAAKELVKSIQPSVIYRATYFAQPPEKSLSKHQMITDMLENAGYEIAQAGTDVYGRQFWLMTRHGDE